MQNETRVICTLFDHRYMARGLCMISSARRHGFTGEIWVLCLTPECKHALDQFSPQGVQTLTLEELEAHIPGLRGAREDRTVLEYYYTCMAALHRYLFDRLPEVMATMYVDADMYFFARPDIVFNAMGDAPVAVTPHNFPAEKRAEQEAYGIYNAGWTAFRRSAEGQACLDWWVARSIEWCRSHVDGYRYANQGYLTRFKDYAPHMRVLSQKGFNCAPWNICGYAVSGTDGAVLVDGEPLVFFHFHGLARRFGFFYVSHHRAYGRPLTWIMRKRLYRPYVSELIRTERRLQGLASVAKAASLAGTSGDLEQRRKTIGGLLGRILHTSDNFYRTIWRVLSSRPLLVFGSQVW